MKPDDFPEALDFPKTHNSEPINNRENQEILGKVLAEMKDSSGPREVRHRINWTIKEFLESKGYKVIQDKWMETDWFVISWDVPEEDH